MRVFYVFKVNNYYYNMYQNNPYKLFKIFQEIHYTNYYDLNIAKKNIEQIIEKYNPIKINKQIINSLYYNNDYFNKNNIHIICNNYEYTKLIVENSIIRIKSNQSQPTLLKYLEDENIFVCDFKNRNYFFLNLVKSVA